MEDREACKNVDVCMYIADINGSAYSSLYLYDAPVNQKCFCDNDVAQHNG